MERDAMERGGYVLQHTPPAGIFFAGVGAMAGRLVFVISEPFTQQQRDSLEGFDFHLVLEIDDSSPLVTMRREADGTVELVAIDYAKLLACAYNLKLPGCGLGLGLGLRLGLGLGLRLGLGAVTHPALMSVEQQLPRQGKVCHGTRASRETTASAVMAAASWCTWWARRARFTSTNRSSCAAGT